MAHVLVVGPGAVGIQCAVRLAEAGHDVVVGTRDEAAARRLPAALTAIDHDGTAHRAEVPAVADPRHVRAADILLLATRCDDAAAALETWLPCLAEGGVALTMQNGLLGDALAAVAGDRFLECTVAFPATWTAPGRSELTGPGGLIVGPWPDVRMAPVARVEPVAQVLADAFPTRVHQNMLGVKWTKLLINSAITGLGALTGQALGQMMAQRRARAAFLHIVTEGEQAGKAAGIRFEKVAGFHPRMAAIGRPHRLPVATRHLLLRWLGRHYGRQRSSSLQSLERGRRTEVSHLNGRIVAEAARHGLEAPVNAAVLDMVTRIEEGQPRPAPARLDDLPLRFL